jgi:hypothetical protein
VPTSTFTAADLAYLGENFHTLEELCRDRDETPDHVRALIDSGLLPRPSYVLDDGTELFPGDYFRLSDEAGGQALRACFVERYRAAGGRLEDAEGEWADYLSGLYSVCLRDVTPETIVHKGALVDAVSALMEDPRPGEDRWRDELCRQVDELDALEREFSPDYDRGRFGEPPSRDRLIVAAHERYPEVFASSVKGR